MRPRVCCHQSTIIHFKWPHILAIQANVFCTIPIPHTAVYFRLFLHHQHIAYYYQFVPFIFPCLTCHNYHTRLYPQHTCPANHHSCSGNHNTCYANHCLYCTVALCSQPHPLTQQNTPPQFHHHQQKTLIVPTVSHPQNYLEHILASRRTVVQLLQCSLAPQCKIIWCHVLLKECRHSHVVVLLIVTNQRGFATASFSF